MNHIHIFATVFAMTICSFTAVGQSGSSGPADTPANVHAMDDVVITGQYISRSISNAVHKIDIIDRKKIDAMAAQNLRDVLTNQLDIRLSYDPVFGAGMSMQGSKAYGADAKILIDGVPVVGKQNGMIDLTQINLSNIDRIEIITGPMSVSYGTDAIAGTVNLITRKVPKHRMESSLNSYYESIGTYNANFHTGVRLGKHSLMCDANRNFFGGWNPADKPSFWNFSPRLADTNRDQLWKPREQYSGTLQYVVPVKKLTFNYKGNYFCEKITARGEPLLPYREMAFDNIFHTFRKDNAVFINGEIAQNKNVSVMAAFNDYKRIKNEYTADLTTLNAEIDHSIQDTSRYYEANSRGALSVSVQNRKLVYEVGYDLNLQFANSTQIEGRKQGMDNYAVFASAEYRPINNFTIRPGMRYGYNSRYKMPVVPSVNFMYKTAENWTFRTSYARGFRQPGLKELYFELVDINHNIHGNTELEAEYSDNLSASIVYAGRVQNARFKISTASFYNDIRQLISLAAVANGSANEYTYVNVGTYRSKGVQLTGELSIRSLSVTVGGSYNGTYSAWSGGKGMPGFSYSPEVRGSVNYVFRKQGISTSVFYKYTGRFVTYTLNSADELVQSFVNGYHTADLTLSLPMLKKHVVLSSGCKNLFDVRNVSGNQSVGAHTTGSNSLAVGTGRYFFLKADINISKQ